MMMLLVAIVACTPVPSVHPFGNIKMGKMFKKHVGMDVFKEIADLGNEYWNLLKADPYVSASVTSVADEIAALKKSIAHIEAGKAILEPKYANRRKSTSNWCQP